MRLIPHLAFMPPMTFKALASSALVASLSLSPLSPMARPAQADSKDVVAGLIIGGIIGSAIASEKGKKKKKAGSKGSSKSKSTKAKAPAISAEEKAANAEVQEALNHFGWSVGAADGAIGPKSRAAIKEYQAFLGFPATGELTEHERTVLVTAYHRAQAGGSAIAEIVSGSVYGLRGVLIAQADEMKAAPAGTLAAAPKDETSPQPGSVAAAAAAAIPVLLPKPAEEPTVAAPAAPIVASPKPAVAPEPEPPLTAAVETAPPAVAPVAPVSPEPPAPAVAAVLPEPAPAEPAAPVADSPEVVASDVVSPEPEAPEVADAEDPAPSGPGLPTFLDANGGKGTLLAACNAAMMQASANGGMATEATLTDARLALTEQFCLARSEAVAQSEALMKGIQGFTPNQIAAQCAGLAPVLSEHVAALSLKPRDEVLSGVEAFILSSGMPPAQLAGTAKVCLGLGYAEERMDVAIGAALMLTALGERAYAELPGHHLARGFGATERADLAEGWYQMAADAIGQGGAVFARDADGRDTLILKAALALSGKAPLAPPAIQEATLPTFVVPEAAPAAAPVAPVSAPVVEGPGADAIRMSAGFARLAVEAPLMLLGATSQ